MVVPAGLELMAGLVRDADLGVIAESAAPADLAVAISSILDRPETERAAWRQRIAATAAERFTWPVAARAYLGLIRSLGEPPDPAPPAGPAR